MAEGAPDVKQVGDEATKQNRMALRTTLSHNGRRQFSGLSVVVRTFPSRMNHGKEVNKSHPKPENGIGEVSVP